MNADAVAAFPRLRRELSLTLALCVRRYYITRAKLVSKIAKYPHVVSVLPTRVLAPRSPLTSDLAPLRRTIDAR